MSPKKSRCSPQMSAEKAKTFNLRLDTVNTSVKDIWKQLKSISFKREDKPCTISSSGSNLQPLCQQPCFSSMRSHCETLCKLQPSFWFISTSPRVLSHPQACHCCVWKGLLFCLRNLPSQGWWFWRSSLISAAGPKTLLSFYLTFLFFVRDSFLSFWWELNLILHCWLYGFLTKACDPFCVSTQSERPN